MEMFKFTKGDLVKVCHCHKGVREALLKDGWKEDKPTGKTSKKKAK